MIYRHPYTLLEMIVVTAVIMLVVGVATVNFSNLRLDKSPDELTEELRRMGALCRRYAIAQGKPQEVFYYHEKRIIKFDKESIYLPAETKLSVNGVEPEEDFPRLRQQKKRTPLIVSFALLAIPAPIM